MSDIEPYFVSSECFNVDLGLIDVRDNVEEPWCLRALAGHSVGMPLEDGYLASAELLDAFEWMLSGRAEGKAKLTCILFAPCNDYQRALYYCLAGRESFGVIADLPRLVALMKARLELGREAEDKEWGLNKAHEPYLSEGPDGPLDPNDTGFALPRSLADFVRSA